MTSYSWIYNHSWLSSPNGHRAFSEEASKATRENLCASALKRVESKTEPTDEQAE